MNDPPVELALAAEAVEPGGILRGAIQLSDRVPTGRIEDMFLELVAYGEAQPPAVIFRRFSVGGLVGRLEGGMAGRFTAAVPWETPVTQLFGVTLPVTVAVRATVAVSGVRGKGPLLPFPVRPLPVQEAVANGIANLGFTLTSARMVQGQIAGTTQRLPFYQEFRLAAPGQYRRVMRELSLILLTHAGGVEVAMDSDRPTGSNAGGVLAQFIVRHEDVARRDWADEAERWLQHLTARGGTRAIPLPHRPVDRPGTTSWKSPPDQRSHPPGTVTNQGQPSSPV